jgi:hypothetical protein
VWWLESARRARVEALGSVLVQSAEAIRASQHS